MEKNKPKPAYYGRTKEYIERHKKYSKERNKKKKKEKDDFYTLIVGSNP